MDSIFRNPVWLSLFDTDLGRVMGLFVVVLGVVVVKCARPLSEVWLKDRRSDREHELQKMKLLAKIDEKRNLRRAERLKLDD